MLEKSEKKGSKRVFLTVLLACLGTGVLVFLVTFWYLGSGRPVPQTTQPPQVQGNTGTPQPQQIAGQITVPVTSSVADVAKSATPGVVGISVLKVDSGAIFDKDATQKWGVGSGVIVSPSGYILTNNHVAGGKSKRIIVSLFDGKNVDGVTVWSDPILDLAIVKVNATGLTAIPLGDANTLQVGETAVAIGNPLGLQFQRTVTSGIVSALNRTIKIDTDQGSNYMEDLIQTDASINPGNSGGPLLNSKGQVVGINTIKVTSAEAIGFAVPINVAVPIINQYVAKGDFKEPYLGVFAYDKEVIPYLGKDIHLDNGIYVANVDEEGPAFKSGIKVGCIIKQVDGMNISTMMQLRTYIYSKSPGDTINVTHFMNGKDVTTPIVLAAKPKDGLVTR
ncbi:MAG: trypsin-like peptidase domain-containing protein [Clostridiales bacterium]|jgi:S1-C subfamily serine protease|nr:trypsin-like peptidase domain-containing protein [Eubacteriales bacterium]MDH7567564.1 trypsin-like peptidase domain-containing protein [Clostridiales bacterium]